MEIVFFWVVLSVVAGIVAAAKGRSGFVDMIMGSIAQKIVSGAKQPVVLVK